MNMDVDESHRPLFFVTETAVGLSFGLAAVIAAPIALRVAEAVALAPPDCLFPLLKFLLSTHHFFFFSPSSSGAVYWLYNSKRNSIRSVSFLKGWLR